MRQKCNIIRSTSRLAELVPELNTDGPDDPILLRSSHYIAAACDLSDINSLGTIFSGLNIESYVILFIAEVSMTYMEVEAADEVINWASKFSQGHFCLLEQWMPDGPDHPFTSTMIKHFEKLNSPLKSPYKYQDADSLRQRFQKSGWHSVRINSLWSLWSDESFVQASERIELDEIEQFDEWEEFALFSSHYFLLVADSSSSKIAIENRQKRSPTTVGRVNCTFSPYLAVEQLHRNGAHFRIGRSTFVCHGGLGTSGRTSNSFIYSIDHRNELSGRSSLLLGQPQFPKIELTFHTITSLSHGDSMLVGGRTAPNLVSKKCFLFHEGSWKQVADLPDARYRHSAVSVETRLSDSSSSTVLLFGGRNSAGDAIDEWLLWDPKSSQWFQLEVIGDTPPNRFSASMSVNLQTRKDGHLCGGIGAGKTILYDLWHWELVLDQNVIKVKCVKSTSPLSNYHHNQCFSRVGASLIEHATCLYLIGGVGCSDLISASEAMLRIDKTCDVHISTFDSDIPRPLLVGHSLEAIESSQGELSIVITGGGAVCFSFGTYWNQGCYTVSSSHTKLKIQPWTISSGQTISSSGLETLGQNNSGVGVSSSVLTNRHKFRINGSTSKMPSENEPVELRVTSEVLANSESFAAVMETAHPQVLKGLDIGACTTTWDLDYLRRRIGDDRLVTVHSSHSANMDFLEKNFEYKRISFAEFIKQVQSGGRIYLRSLSSEKPLQKPTKLEDDFPSISQDFKLPPELDYVAQNLHSSPLRISGPVNMWLHFDVMANVLCQIRGRKRLVLFHPAVVGRLGIPHGASSSKMRIFGDSGHLLPEVNDYDPFICDLEAGDVLFIPALWPHAAYPSDGDSIAVNVFFRSLKDGYAAGKDTYGNRDIQAYENGRKDIERIQKSFQHLPQDFKTFYLKRLAEELACTGHG